MQSKHLHLPKDRWQSLFYVLVATLLIFPLFEQIDIVGETLLFWGMHFFIIGLISLKLAKGGQRLFFFVFVCLFLSSFVKESTILLFFQALTLFLLYGFSMARLIRSLQEAKEIATNELYGAISLYLMMGISWCLCYIMTQVLFPNSFDFGVSVSLAPLNWTDLLYFSFITLTTTGYGDIVPLSGLAKALAMLESVMGILFIGVALSLVVSKHGKGN